jgi:hypothetical protein
MAFLIPRFAHEEIDPRRRALVMAALRGGLLGAALPVAGLRTATGAWFGSVPRRMPAGRSIYELSGQITVNARPANLESVIRPGDTVAAGPASRAVFVVGSNAHILRENSRIQLADGSTVAGVLRVLTGKLLSVFGRRKVRIQTSIATIGIRGTGVYVEADPEESYICTCFGTADLIPAGAPEPEETVVSEHHDAPRFATLSGERRIRKAPFRDHTDLEVALIEELAGRVPPFAFTLDRFDSPLRTY